ncbi:hypothetical protein NHX12_031590 [Muraenolepis orangiensis]|uniref:SH3 domain-containing protein n=1 Tax=Muraenolepis orangiensis TaxID=630683 RepID=A0A9Q0IJU1_9TELE|nr:hypothetical protein NHX12_031590 [Muraenolepis orangiensis]
MDWGTDLWDQYDIIEKHTLSGLDLVEKYVKFVKERTEIEQNYAKQLRNLSKKYNPKRASKEEPECRVSSFLSFSEIQNELNDYAGQRELYLSEAKKAQQSLESTYKQLENSKKRFEREWREAERAAQYAEKTDQDINATKADVEKECKNDYAAQLQKCNKEQNQFYFNDMPVIFNKLQDMDERRGQRLAHGYALFSDTEKQVMPIIGKCLEGINKAGSNVNQRNDSLALIEQHKSGFERPGDLEFEDYSQAINRTSSDSSLSTPKGPMDLLGKNRNKNFWLFKKSKLSSSSTLSPLSTPSTPSPSNGAPSPKFGRDPLSYCLKEINRTVKPRISSFRTLRRSKFTPERIMPTTEDFGHLPPEQRRKRLQQKRDDVSKELQKEMGDPASLAPQISQTAQNIDRLRGELGKYEAWLAEAVGRGGTLQYRSHSFNNNGAHDVYSPDGAQSDEAMYNFPGASEGTISMQEGEVLDMVEEDKGDGWTRVRRPNGDEGYIPTSYVSIALKK